MIKSIEIMGPFFSSTSGALIVVPGALYALLFAMGFFRCNGAFWTKATSSFAVLTIAITYQLDGRPSEGHSRFIRSTAPLQLVPEGK